MLRGIKVIEFVPYNQIFQKELETLKSQTYVVLDKGQSMIADGYFDKEEEEQFQNRMDIDAKRMHNLLEQSQKDQER